MARIGPKHSLHGFTGQAHGSCCDLRSGPVTPWSVLRVGCWRILWNLRFPLRPTEPAVARCCHSPSFPARRNSITLSDPDTHLGSRHCPGFEAKPARRGCLVGALLLSPLCHSSQPHKQGGGLILPRGCCRAPSRASCGVRSFSLWVPSVRRYGMFFLLLIWAGCNLKTVGLNSAVRAAVSVNSTVFRSSVCCISDYSNGLALWIGCP